MQGPQPRFSLFLYPGGEKLQFVSWQRTVGNVSGCRSKKMHLPLILRSRRSRTTCTHVSCRMARSLSKHLHLLPHSAVEMNSRMVSSSHNANLSCQQSTFRDPPCFEPFVGALALAMIKFFASSFIFSVLYHYTHWVC